MNFPINNLMLQDPGESKGAPEQTSRGTEKVGKTLLQQIHCRDVVDNNCRCFLLWR